MILTKGWSCKERAATMTFFEISMAPSILWIFLWVTENDR